MQIIYPFPFSVLDAQEKHCTRVAHTPRKPRVTGTVYLTLLLEGEDFNRQTLIGAVVSRLSLWLNDAVVCDVSENLFVRDERTVKVKANLCATVLSLDVLKAKVNPTVDTVGLTDLPGKFGLGLGLGLGGLTDLPREFDVVL